MPRHYYRKRAVRRRGRGYGYRRSYAKKHKFVQRTSFALAQKFFDYAQAGTLGSSADCSGLELDDSTYKHLTPVASGSGVSTRNGRGIIIKSLYIRGICYIPGKDDLNETCETIRKFTLCIVRDRKTNGTQVSSTSVFTNPNGSQQLMTPLRNIYQARNYDVLWSRTYAIRVEHYNRVVEWTNADPANSVVTKAHVGNYGIRKEFKVFLKMNIPQTYVDAGANIDSVADNSLHLMGWQHGSDAGAGYQSNVNPSFYYTVRFRFLDNC